MSSILTDTKNALGLLPDYEPFDAQLVLHINSVISDLNLLGIGPDAGYMILDETEEWTDLIDSDLAVEPRLNHIKSYMYLRVRMLFDPPDVGYLVTAYEKMIEKAEFMIITASDEIRNPVPIVIPDAVDIFGEVVPGVVVLDGGTG